MGATDEGYIAIAGWRRYSRGDIRRPDWIKLPVGLLLDDDDFAAMPELTRWLYLGLLALASRNDGLVAYDRRRIASRLGLTVQHLKPRIQTLLDAGYIELHEHVRTLAEGSLQMALDTETTSRRPRDEGETTPETTPRRPSDASVDPTEESGLVANHPIGAPAPTRAPPRGDKTREREVLSKTKRREGPRAPALPLSQEPENEILRRLVVHAANGDPKSGAQIVRAATGLPDAALSQTLESLMLRRPKPRNPGGYVVQTLRRIREEGGYAALETATIDREPRLG